MDEHELEAGAAPSRTAGGPGADAGVRRDGPGPSPGPAPAGAVLSIRGITKSFGPIEVLHGVGLDLMPGEVHAVIGENGAGKSTLMKILSGYLPPSSGSILLDGSPADLASGAAGEARGILLIHQEFSLAEHLTVEENVFLGRERRVSGLLDKRRMRAETAEVLRQLDSAVDPRRRIRDLSVSEKQMVEIARAISRSARVLIMDEPTAVLSAAETAILFRLIRRLRDAGTTVVYISHKLDEVKAISDRVTVLRDGRLITTAPTAELSQDDMARLMVGRELSDLYPPKHPAPAGAPVVLAVERLTVPGFVADASFELRRGEILGFAGLVGAGRTELMEGLLGLRRRTAGAIRRDGRPIRIRSPRDAASAGIVYLTEDRKGKGLLLRMRLRPNLTLMALDRYSHPLVDERQEQRALVEAVQRFDIRVGRLDAVAGTLSGGNQQKLLLAKTLQVEPGIVIIDEPTRGIDVGTKHEIYVFIAGLAAAGTSCIVISSEMPELIGLAHRVLVMRAGRIVGELEGAAISEAEIVRYATGLKGGADAGADTGAGGRAAGAA